jgi:hypothetical protein
MSIQESIKATEIQVSLLMTNSDTPAQQLSWVIRGFLCNVCSHTLKGNIRRAEAMSVALRMLNSAHETKAVSFEEFQTISQQITNIEEQIYPGCSLI